MGRRRGGMCDGTKFVVKLVEIDSTEGQSLWRWMLCRIGGRVMSHRKPPKRRPGMWNVKFRGDYHCADGQVKRNKGKSKKRQRPESFIHGFGWPLCWS